MTRTKKELKKRGYKFNEDYPMLPCTIDGMVQIEDTAMTITRDGFLIKKVYDVDVLRIFIDKNFKEIPVYEFNATPELSVEIGNIRIWNNCPNYLMVYDTDDNLLYVRFNPYL